MTQIPAIRILKTDGADAPAPDHETLPADRTEKGPVETTTWNHFTGENDRLYCGIWASSPGKHRVSYDEWEFCHLIEGEAVLTDENGHAVHIKTGEGFIIPAGFKGTWESLTPLKKHYVILLPEEK
ncbi:MAG: cupin domain-containing protein [Micavibrio sp.]|nr:MAG: cupin domain-containing protein [Micavibrio sp.]